MNIIEMLKADIAVNLEKKGFTLEQLEQELTEFTKKASLQKEGEGVLKDSLDFGKDVVSNLYGATTHGVGALGHVLDGSLTASIMAGTLGGGGLYAADHYMQGQDRVLTNKQQEVDRLRSVTNRLKTDYGIK